MAATSSSLSDTNVVVRNLVVERLRFMSVSEKVDIVVRLTDNCLALAVAGIRQRHPAADDHEVRMRLGVLRVGPALMLEAFGWDVAEHGY
jgi:hypothetical protein